MKSEYHMFGDQKRYHTLDQYLKNRFGHKVFKLSLDAGFTCPNRDGSKGIGGCTFCSARGSGDFVFGDPQHLHSQLEAGVQLVRKKWPTGSYIAYLQAYSNTYAPAAQLRTVYDTALSFPQVVGLAIATRPDCLSPAVLDLLAAYKQKTLLWVELGVQSIHSRTTSQLNLQYDYADYLRAYEQLTQRQIPICAHVILGLPGETHEDMQQTVQALTQQPLFGLKLHMLHIIQGTVLGQQYQARPFPLMTREEYVTLITDLLEQIPAETIIHRLTGDGPKDQTLAPTWTFHKLKVLSDIDRELRLRDTWQGKYARKG